MIAVITSVGRLVLILLGVPVVFVAFLMAMKISVWFLLFLCELSGIL